MAKKKKDIKKILKLISFILAGILIIELGFLMYSKIKLEKNTNYINSVNSLIATNNGYVSVGQSDFKHSKFYKYVRPGYAQAKLTKYNKDFKIEFEARYGKDYYSNFNDVIEVKDGYIAVGEIQMSKKQNENGIYEGLIIKFDKKGQEVWRKNFKIHEVTKLNKIIENSEGNYIVVGQSQYLDNIVGNHKTGGAVMLEYSPEGKLLTQTDYEGPRNSVYNDLIEVENGYIAVGKIRTATGIIIKYSDSFEIQWRKLYSNTDEYGLKAIAKLDDKYFIVAGSKLGINDDSQAAVMFKYDYKGNKIGEVTYSEGTINRFQDIIVEGNKIYTTILSSSKRKDDSVSSIVSIYDQKFELIKEQTISSNKSVVINGLIKDNGKLLSYGYTNSKIKEIKSNGKDIVPLFIKVNEDLKLDYVKE